MGNVFTKCTPVDVSESLYRLKEALVAGGYVHQGSGCTGSGTKPGDVGTDGYSVRAGNAYDRCNNTYRFSQTYAYWIGRSPDGQREILLQRSDYITWCRVAYSFSSHFVGGSGVPSPTVYPVAADIQYIAGAAATRVPVFGTDGTYRLKIMVQNTAPYGWWLWTHPTGGGAGSGMLYMDPMKAGSFPAEDVDPYVFGFNNANSAYAYFASVIAAEGTPPGTGYCGGYLAKGLAGEAWVNIPGSFPSNSGNRPFYGGGVATNAHNGKDESFALQYIRSAALAAPNGCKGVSSLFRWVGGSRSNGETMNKTTAKDKIVMGHVLADWDGTDPEL